MTKQDNWKQFRDTNIYANALGQVKRVSSKGKEYIFKTKKYRKSNGCVMIAIYHNKQKLQVKNVVWECFNGAIPDGYIVLNKNGCRTMNELYNLELVKWGELGKRYGAKNKTRFIIDKTHNRVYKGCKDAAKHLFVSPSCIKRCCNKQVKHPMYELEWGGLVSGEDL